MHILTDLRTQKVNPMTPWQNRVTDLSRRMADDMKLRNYSQSTIDAYTYHVGKFAEFLGKSPLEATPEDIRSFQLQMIEVRKFGWSSFNQAVCGLRFLFRTTSPRPWPVAMIPFGKRPKAGGPQPIRATARRHAQIWLLSAVFTADLKNYRQCSAVKKSTGCFRV